jgi:hypothetical protein
MAFRTYMDKGSLKYCSEISLSLIKNDHVFAYYFHSCIKNT